MRQTKKVVAKYAGASALALLIATSVFAAPAQWQGGPQPATSQPGRARAVSNVPNPQNSRQSTLPQGGTNPGAGYGQSGRQSTPPQRGTNPGGGYGQSGRQSTPPQGGTNPGAGYGQSRQSTPPQRDTNPGAGYGQSGRQSTPPQRSTNPGASYGWNGQNSRPSTPPQRSTTPGANYGSHRENDRVNRSGRVSSISRDRDGYRVQLDRGDSFWIPSTRLGNRARDLRVGVSISLGGIFQGGMINVDAVTWPSASGYGYDQGSVSGVVESIDYRSGILMLRDDASGISINVDMRSAQSARVDLRPGDYVTLSGNWVRGNVFDAYRIDAVNNGRY
jgi:hypothetical protein